MTSAVYYDYDVMYEYSLFFVSKSPDQTPGNMEIKAGDCRWHGHLNQIFLRGLYGNVYKLYHLWG